MKTYNLTNIFTLASLIIFPSFIVVNRQLAGITFILVMIFGCKNLLMGERAAFRCSRSEMIFFVSLSLLALSVLISAVANDAGFKILGRMLIPLWAIPIYYWYKNNPANEGALWFGLVCGAAGTALVAIYQILVLDGYNRALGITHPIVFGDIAMVMGLMLVAGSGWFVKQYRWGAIFPVLGLACGLLASALSLSRGAWLALPAAIVLFAWFSTKHISIVKLLSALVLILVTLSVIYNTPQFKVKDRVDFTVTNLRDYIASDNVDDPARRTPLGTRLEMWKTAWYIFQENPWVGVGGHSYQSSAEKYVAQKLVSEVVANYTHPHNQFLSSLAKGGLFELIALVLFFGVPLVVFYRLLISADASPEAKRMGLAGLVFILSFMVFALTEAIFERYRPMTFFAFYLTVLMAFMNSSKKSEDN